MVDRSSLDKGYPMLTISVGAATNWLSPAPGQHPEHTRWASIGGEGLMSAKRINRASKPLIATYNLFKMRIVQLVAVNRESAALARSSARNKCDEQCLVRGSGNTTIPALHVLKKDLFWYKKGFMIRMPSNVSCSISR